MQVAKVVRPAAEKKGELQTHVFPSFNKSKKIKLQICSPPVGTHISSFCSSSSYLCMLRLRLGKIKGSQQFSVGPDLGWSRYMRSSNGSDNPDSAYQCGHVAVLLINPVLWRKYFKVFPCVTSFLGRPLANWEMFLPTCLLVILSTRWIPPWWSQVSLSGFLWKSSHHSPLALQWGKV